MKQHERQIQKLLRQLGINSSYLGFHYLSHGIQLVINDPLLLLHMCKGLYIDIASHFNTNIGCVERDIRTVKIRMIKYGDEELIDEIFGNKKVNLSNSEFIDLLCQYIIDMLILK